MYDLLVQSDDRLTQIRLDIESKLTEFYDNLDVDIETRKTYIKGVKNFARWIRDNDIHFIDKKVMIRYRDYLIETKEDTTASTYWSGVKNYFKFLEEEYGIYNVMKNIKGISVTRQFRKQPLTKKQVLTIKKDRSTNIETLQDYRDYAIFNLLLHTGMRTIEVNRANITDIKVIEGQYALSIQGKGKKAKTQVAILTDSVLVPLLKYLTIRGKDEFEPLFIGLASNKYGTRLTTRSISRIIKNILVNNGYDRKELTAHSLRHTATTFVLKGGGDLQEAKEFARHSDINTTLIYSHNINRVENAPEHYIDKYLESDD